MRRGSGTAFSGLAVFSFLEATCDVVMPGHAEEAMVFNRGNRYEVEKRRVRLWNIAEGKPVWEQPASMDARRFFP